MRVSIIGKCIRTDVREVVAAIRYCVDRLIDERSLYENLAVTLKFRSFMVHNERSYANCSTTGEPNPRSFMIEMDDMLTRRPALLAACHESVHVRQMARGQMQRLTPRRTAWMGVDVEETGEWKNFPWEVEAISLENELYRDFLGYMKRSKKS